MILICVLHYYIQALGQECCEAFITSPPQSFDFSVCSIWIYIQDSVLVLFPCGMWISSCSHLDSVALKCSLLHYGIIQFNGRELQ